MRYVLDPELKADGNPLNNAQGDHTGERLRRYWLTGQGAAEIRWNTPGDFKRCVRKLRKHLGVRTEGYCAKLHHTATGMWPGDGDNRDDGIRNGSNIARRAVRATTRGRRGSKGFGTCCDGCEEKAVHDGVWTFATVTRRPLPSIDEVKAAASSEPGPRVNLAHPLARGLTALFVPRVGGQ